MPWKQFQTSRLRRIFFETFSAMDIAQPLASFDAEADAEKTKAFMLEHGLNLIGIRVNGQVAGYARVETLAHGQCGAYLHPFTNDDVVSDTANLVEVVKSLAINEQCFVTILDHVGAIITLSDLEKPPMRMFLFGIITLGEMTMTEIIRRRFADGSWQEHLSPQRVEKARWLQEERSRRGQHVDLVDCLQYGDKGVILSYVEDIRNALGLESRREMRKTLKEVELLRNNLAHTQEIIPTSWQRIVIACSRLEHNLEIMAHGIASSEEEQKMP